MGKPEPFGKWGGRSSFSRYMSAKHRTIDNPSRARILVRGVLAQLGLRYKETVGIMYRGKLLAFEFFIKTVNGNLVALLFDPQTGGGLKDREKRIFKSKTDFLEERQIKYMVVGRKETSQTYLLLVKRLVLSNNTHSNQKGVDHE